MFKRATVAQGIAHGVAARTFHRAGQRIDGQIEPLTCTRFATVEGYTRGNANNQQVQGQ